MKINKGFTLIELLVVIAVIAILAGIVISSLSQSRTRAKDAAILTEMDQLATGIELETNALGVYTDVCDLFDAGNDLEHIKTSIEDHGGIWDSCVDDNESYAVVVTLNAQQAYSPFAQQAYARESTTVCHLPGASQETIQVTGARDSQAVLDHVAHGDYLDVCAEVESFDYDGVHADDEALLSNKDIKDLREEAENNGDTFIEPKYYCIGTVPSRASEKSLRKGYLYAVPAGGCGSPAPSFTEALEAYGNRE